MSIPLPDLTDAECEALLYDWLTWARPDQLLPDGDWWRNWLILAGRGWGKTRTGAETVRAIVAPGHYGRLALIGQTSADVRDVIVEGESGILATSPPWFRPVYEPSKRRLTWPNGAMATTYSGDEPDQLRGPQHDAALCDELAKWKYAQDAWDNLQMGMRLGRRPLAVITTTPRPIPIIKSIAADPQTVVTRGNTYDNAANLPASTMAYLRRKYEGSRLGRQELYAEILDDAPGALWKRDTITANRVAGHPDLVRVVVAVDPAATSSKASDETGIVAAGLGVDGFGYLLTDLSLKASPDGWGTAAVGGYRQHQADRIIGEANNGGEMVEHVIRTVDPNVSYKAVHASRGKQTRAEPIAALYEQGRIKHVGHFPALENQMCTWVPGMKSPDRMDALVWAFTELMLTGAEELHYA